VNEGLKGLSCWGRFGNNRWFTILQPVMVSSENKEIKGGDIWA
jgi:hypothetical protein